MKDFITIERWETFCAIPPHFKHTLHSREQIRGGVIEEEPLVDIIQQDIGHT